VYKKITRLRSLIRCGMCGTTRHTTTPFWNLGMRVCRYCLQDNLVSHTVLDERYWTNVWDERPMCAVHEGIDITTHFIDAVAGKVFYFREYGTSLQRLEYSNDLLDFKLARQRKNMVVWLFWKPHLAKIIDLDVLERNALKKQVAAEVIRAIVRRGLTLRTLAYGCKRGKSPKMTEWSKRPDKRTALFRLHKSIALDPPSRAAKHCGELNRKLTEYEDRLLGHRTPTIQEEDDNDHVPPFFMQH
jgi:hypothetical protein